MVEVREGKGSTALVTTGRYTYDGRARMTSFADANNNRHRYEWDGVGRLRDVYRDGGLGESPYYTYGYEGPYVVKAFEGDGTPAATWEYDALGRTTEKRVYEEYRAAFFDDPAAYATYTWTWDSIDDAQGVATWNGVRHATADPAGQTRYFYDEYAPFGDRGRLTTLERQNLDLDPLVTHFEHNYAGAVTYTETPGRQFVSTTYSNSQWKLEDVVGPVGGGGLEIVSYDYDGMGLLNGWAIDDAPTTSGFWRADFTLSTPNRLDAVEMGRTEQDSDRTSVDFSYLDNGWLNTKSIQPPFGTTEYLRYRYDKLGRAKSLAYVNAPDTHVFERYTFDDAGNLTHFKQGVGPDRKLWEYAAPVEFGEIPSRIDTRSGVKDTHMWDATTGRLTNWSTVDGLVTLRDRNFEYDGSGRLIYTEQDGEKTYLFYDVDNALVYEDRRGEIYERFSGYRSGPDETIDSVLPMLRVVSHKVGGVQVREPRVAMLDVDGHALFTWDLQGNELSREITGVYGLPLVGPNWDQGELWEIDGLHGSEADRSNEVVHFGVRHTILRDGMWMQPEPLFAIGIPSLNPRNPGAAGPVLAGGNPIVFADTSGYSSWAIALVLWSSEAGENAQPTLLDNFAQGAVAGDLIENPNAAQMMGQIAVGFTPAGVVADIRDFEVNAWRGDLLGTALAGVGFMPGFGDAAKIGVKGALRAFGDACFVSGTRISAVTGPVRIEDIALGDRVLAQAIVSAEEGADGAVSPSGVRPRVSAASTNGDEEGWMKVESDESMKSSAWSPRGVCSRLAKAGQKAVLPAMLAVCHPASGAVELPNDVAVARVYDARTGAWEKGLVGELEVGDEVLHEGHLLRVTAERVDDRGFAEVGQLSEADATWTVDGVTNAPDAEDWVLLLGDADDAGHWRLQDLAFGDRFAFGGRVFETGVLDGEQAVRATELVLSRVLQTIVRQSDTVVDAEIVYDNGAFEVITGTPEHPFWVPKLQAWVPLGELVEGTALHVDSGAGAILVSATWRQGDFTVYNFEVEGTHNYFVRAPDSDAPAVLVHNADCFKAVANTLRGLKGVPWGRFCKTGCEGVASKIQDAVGGRIHRIKPPRGASNLGKRNGRETSWTHHEAVVKDGRVYDALTGPEGLSIDDFKATFEYNDVIDFGF